MKKFIFSLLVLMISAAHAEEITVLDTYYSRMNTMSTRIDARFQMNKSTTEGFANITVTEDHYVGVPGPWGTGPTYYPVITFQDSVKIEGLMLMGDKVIYHGAEGDVDCGTLGESRIFKRPTIYLTGKCQLRGRIVGPRLVVKLITK